MCPLLQKASLTQLEHLTRLSPGVSQHQSFLGDLALAGGQSGSSPATHLGGGQCPTAPKGTSATPFYLSQFEGILKADKDENEDSDLESPGTVIW